MSICFIPSLQILLKLVFGSICRRIETQCPFKRSDLAAEIPSHLLRSLTEEQLTIEDDAVDQIIKHYCRESGVRNLQKHIDRVGISASTIT